MDNFARTDVVASTYGMTVASYLFHIDNDSITDGTKAIGDPGDSIVFSVNDTLGWSTFENPTGGWGGILFADSTGTMADNDSSILEGLILKVIGKD